jgi:YD repeat-containing protein
MVAIVSGNGLGLERSSANILGGRGQLGSAFLGRGNDRVSVNAANGNLIIQNTDEVLVGRGPDAVLNRTYNSLGAYTDLAGAADPDNWLTNTQRKIVLGGASTTVGNIAGSTATLTDWDGTVIVFNWVNTTVGYKASENPYRDDTLTWAANVFTWTEGKSQTGQTFASNIGGRLVSAADADGNTITYTYDAATTAGKLTRVTTANSSGTQFNYTDMTYTGTNLMTLVTSFFDTVSATNKTLTRTRYAYDTSNRLKRASVDLSPGDNTVGTDVYWMNYAYVGTSKQISTIAQSDGTSLAVTYVATAGPTLGRVATLTLIAASGDTRVTSFAYDTVNRITTTTDPLLNVSKMTYDAAGRLTRVEEPAPVAGGLPSITDYTYNTNGDVMTAFVTEGIGGTAIARDFYQYDTNGNVTQLYRWTGTDYRVTRWTYGAKNELLTEMVFANVDADGDGGVAPTGGETTRYAYDAENHLRFVVSPEGRVTEYRYDAPGNLIATISYSGTVYATGGLAANVSIAESTLATWVSGTADKAQSQRTDTVYDFRGNITTAMSWSTTDAAGNGVTTANWSRMTYVYDQFGKLLSRLVSGTNDLGGEPTYTAETFVYDGLGRAISTVDIFGVASTIAYNDTARTTTVTTPNDTTKASTFNIAGELISFVESDTGITAGTTLYAYDKLGRLRVKTDAVGVKTYYLYDKQSRLTAEVDGDGSMTEFKYDAADRMVATVQYTAALTAAQLTTLGTVTANTEVATVRPTAAATDRWSWNIYDKSGKLIQTIDAVGATVQFVYDGAGRLNYSWRRYYQLTATQLSGFKTAPPTSLIMPPDYAGQDRPVRNFYDTDGRLVGTADEEGYLTQIVYDKAGRKVETVRYSSLPNLNNWLLDSFSALLASAGTNANDIHNYWTYDGRGNTIATIDGEGNVTRYHYTARGDVDQEIRGQKVPANTPYTMATLPAPTGTLETTRFFRNAAGLITSQVKTLTGGTETTTFTYDNRGRLLSQTTSETVSTETRTQRFRYDVKGRLIGSLDGVGSATLVANPTDAQIATAIDTYGTRYNYDPADRLISRIDPDGTGAAGRTTRFYYDTDGQLRYEINALGEVMEYRYNALEDRTDTFVYGTRIAPATLTTLTGGLVVAAVTNAVTAIANAALDSREQYVYTDRGQLFVTYDPLYPAAPTADHYSAFYYNSFGEHIQTNQYLNASQTQLDVSTKGHTRRGLKYYDYQYTNYISQGGVGAQQQVYTFDAFGRTTVEYTAYQTDGRNNQYQYDRANRLIGRRDTFYSLSSFAYDARSNLISQTDRSGKVTTFAYDLFNRNVTTTSPEGVVSSVKKNAYGQAILITDGQGRTTSYSYDKNGNLKTVTEAAGTTTNNYDNSDRLIETIDAKGVSTRYTYDAANRVLTRVEDFGTGKLNLTTTTTYDAKGQSISMTDALGVVTTYTYDLKGQKTRIVQDQGAGKLNITTDFVYRSDGKVTFQTDALGTASERKTFFEYDDIGRLTRKTEDQGSGKLNVVTNYFYDETNNLVATSDNLARVTRFVYDFENRLQFSVNAEGEVTENGYDAEGRVIWTRAYGNKIAAALAGFANKITAAQVTGNAATSASDRINRTMYDGDGRAIYGVDGEGFVTRNVYDGANNVIKTIRYADAVGTGNSTLKADMDAALGSSASPPATASVTTYAYDAANRLTDITSAFGTAEATTTHFEMDALGQITYTTVAYGTADASQTYRVFDNVGRVTQETRALGDAAQSTTYFAYNAHGNVTSITDSRGFVTTRAYDNLGRMLSETVPLESGVNATTAYQYDARGNRVKITDPRNNVGYFFYDGTDRLVQQVDPEGYVTETSYAIATTVSSVKRYYNRANNLGSVSVTVKATVTAHSQDATTSFTYDKADRALTATDAMGFTESYAYDGLGNRMSLTNKLGGLTNYAYDKRGLLIWERPEMVAYNSAGGVLASNVRTDYVYDARGNLISLIKAANIAASSLVTSYVYDKLDRLITKTDPAILGQTPVTNYQYDKRGNVILMTAPDGGKTYSFYDDNSRKVAEISPVNTHTTWAYDANGNVTSQKIYSEITNFPASAGGTPPAANGTFRETQFIYDRNNRLTETRIPGVRVGGFNGSNYATAAGQTLTSINQYDAAGNLIREQDSNGSSIYHYYDKNGREIAKIDQENYLTMFDRDSEGNVTRDRRVANKIPVAVSTTSDPVALFNTYNGGISDRITDFSYDKNGRRTHEYRYYVDYATVGATGALSTGQTTATITYYYNGLGEVTHKYESTGDYTYYGYDNQGRMTLMYKTAQTDQNGVTVYDRTDYYYDGLNNLVRESQHEYYSTADERVTQYTYSGGKLHSTTDATGLFTRTYSYNALGQISFEAWSRKLSDGSTTINEGLRYDYDSSGRVVAQKQAVYNGASYVVLGAGYSTEFAYNSYGEVVTKSQSGIVQERFEYDNAGRVTKTSAGDGVWKFLVHDANGNNTLVLQSNGRNLTSDTVDSVLAYVGAIDTMSATDVVATITTYDKRNQATGTREPNRQINAGAAVLITRSQTYNAFGEVASETDARGYTTSYSYNTMGRLTQKVSPQVSMTGENGVASLINPTEKYYYDLSGRLVATGDAVSNATGVAYYTTRMLLANTGYGGTEAKVLKEFRADGSVWETQYDVFGDARVTIDGNNSAIKRANEVNGTNTPYNKTQMSYDAMGRVTQITRPSGLTEGFAYDGLGQRIKHWNSFLQNPATYGQAPILSYIKGIPVYGPAPVLTYETAYEFTDYDIQGRVSSTVDFMKHRTNFTYSWNSTLATGTLGTFGGWEKTTTYVDAAKSMTERTDSFGHLVSKTDLGGITVTYGYDKSGRNTTQTSNTNAENPVAQDLAYTYYNTGKIRKIQDNAAFNAGWYATKITSDFTYDSNGNRLTSRYESSSGYDGFEYEGVVYPGYNYVTVLENTTATYDTLNRITMLTDPGDAARARPSFTTTKTYDANSNVRSSITTHQNIDTNQALSASTTDTYWYRYDSLNRIVTTKGSLVGGVIAPGMAGSDITYDATGQRATATSTRRATRTFPGGRDGPVYVDFDQSSKETYGYSADGHLLTTYIAGSNIMRDGTPIPLSGIGILRVNDVRDAMGRVLTHTEYNEAGAIASERTATYNALSQVLTDATSGTSGTSSTTYNYGINLSTYANGAVVSQTGSSTVSGSTTNSTITNTYMWRDSALLKTISNAQSGAVNGTTNSTLNYDANAHLTSASTTGAQAKQISYTTDSSGQVMVRSQTTNGSTNSPRQFYFYFNGLRIGEIGNNGTDNTDYATTIKNNGTIDGNGPFREGVANGTSYADFDQNYTAINTNSGAESSAGQYTVRQGDTLDGIAQSLWGDASLWYMLAQANGLSGNANLTAGQILTIPAGVTNFRNNASTFKPYDAGQAIGDVQPGAPQPPAAKGKKCGALGAILLVVIAVAITAIVAPQLIGQAAQAAVAATATAPAIAGSLATGLTATLGATGAAIVGGGLAAAAGSVVSQVVGVATGLQEKFSFKAVALAAISGAVGGGLDALGNAATAATKPLGGLLGKVGRFISKPGFISGVARGALSNVLTQGVSIAAGLQKKFDWTGVAVGGVVGGVSNEVGRALKINSPDFRAETIGDYTRQGLTGMAGAIAGAATRSLIEGTDFGDNVLAALPDALAATIGGAIADKVEYELAARAFVNLGLEVFKQLPNAPEGARVEVNGEPITRELVNDALSDRDTRSLMRQMLRAQFREAVKGVPQNVQREIDFASPTLFSDLGFQTPGSGSNLAGLGVNSWSPLDSLRSFGRAVVSKAREFGQWLGSRRIPGSNQTFAQRGAQIARQIDRLVPTVVRQARATAAYVAEAAETIIVTAERAYNTTSRSLRVGADKVALALTAGRYDAGDLAGAVTSEVRAFINAPPAQKLQKLNTLVSTTGGFVVGGLPGAFVGYQLSTNPQAVVQFGSDFIDGVIKGDFSSNNSLGATTGKIVGGFIPLADVRDITAAGIDFYKGKEGSGRNLLLSGVGFVPVIGDGAKAYFKHGDNVVDGLKAGAPEFVTVFRGDRAGTTVIKSHAASEVGYAGSQRIIDSNNLDDLFRSHAVDSTSPPSPFISVTTDPEVARHFAGATGVVNEFRIPLSRATPNPFNNLHVPAGPGGQLRPEQEYLVPNYIRPSEFVRRR